MSGLVPTQWNTTQRFGVRLLDSPKNFYNELLSEQCQGNLRAWCAFGVLWDGFWIFESDFEVRTSLVNCQLKVLTRHRCAVWARKLKPACPNALSSQMLEAFGVAHRKMTLRQGDLVLYDSRTMHCGGSAICIELQTCTPLILHSNPWIAQLPDAWTGANMSDQRRSVFCAQSPVILFACDRWISMGVPTGYIGYREILTEFGAVHWVHWVRGIHHGARDSTRWYNVLWPRVAMSGDEFMLWWKASDEFSVFHSHLPSALLRKLSLGTLTPLHQESCRLQ